MLNTKLLSAGHPQSVETRKKISETLLSQKIKRSKETRQKMSQNNVSFWLGKPESEIPAWKGDKVGYRALHYWVERMLGKPATCEHCEKTNLSGKFIQWANKSGEYKRETTDWIRLCGKCHSKYDRKDFNYA